MRTSLTDIRTIEDHLSDKLPVEESLLFQARLLTDPLLRINLRLQQHIYFLLRAYHRKKIKESANEIHQRLFHDPAKREFQQQVTKLFNP